MVADQQSMRGNLRIIPDDVDIQVTNTPTERGSSVYSLVKYDLIGKIGELVQLTRPIVAGILTGITLAVFGQFKENPEHFISEASRIITEQKATMVIERHNGGLNEPADAGLA